MIKLIFAILFFSIQFCLIYFNPLGKYTIFFVIAIGVFGVYFLAPKPKDLVDAVKKDVFLVNNSSEVDGKKSPPSAS